MCFKDVTITAILKNFQKAETNVKMSQIIVKGYLKKCSECQKGTLNNFGLTTYFNITLLVPL